jgi:ABC-2 type transport system permease protein
MRLHPTFRALWGSFREQAISRATDNFFIGTLFIQPVLFTLLSVGIYQYGGRPNLSMYAVIGAGMIGIWNNNLWTSGSIVQDERRSGTLELLLAAPTSLEIVLLGKSLSNAMASLLALAITIATGLLAYRLPLEIEYPWAFAGAVLLTLVSMTMLGLLLGSLFVLARAAGNLSTVLNYPIFILSGLTFPLTVLPIWIRPLSYSLVSTWGNLALARSAGAIAESSIPITYLALGGLSLVYFLAGHYLYRLIERIVRERGGLEQW